MRLILALLLFTSVSASAQLKSFIMSVHGDTLNRVDMNDKKQGPWVNHVDALRGEDGYDEQGYYIDDKKDGVWVRFSLTGDKIAAENFRWGVLDGKAQYFNRTGGLIREESWRAVDPNKTMDTVNVYDVIDPNKVIDRVVVKLEGKTYKHGTWKYYDPEWGSVVKTEEYFLDKLKNPDEDIKPLDAKANKTPAKPKEVMDYEKKNSGKKKVRTRDGGTGY
ncbi:MAG: hypothetical protein ABI480_13360 [Chitinophagaceae bacterium]